MGDLLDAASELPDGALEFFFRFSVVIAIVEAANGMALTTQAIDDPPEVGAADIKCTLQLTAVQDGLIEEMTKEIVDQIFNATVANW